MNGTLSKILTGLSVLLIAASVLLTILFYIRNSGVNPDASFEVQMKQLGSSLEYFIYWGYFLLIAAAGFALIFPLVKMVINPKSAVKAFIGIVIFAIVIFISYSFADDAVMKIPGYNGPANVPETLKLTGTGIFTMYIMMALAIFSILYTEIVGLFK
jgi:hypothetical protein